MVLIGQYDCADRNGESSSQLLNCNEVGGPAKFRKRELKRRLNVLLAALRAYRPGWLWTATQK
jgi:hypothetical protein